LSVLAAGFFTARYGSEQGPWLATGVVTLVLLVFGDIAPKTIAVGAPLRVSRVVAPGLHALSMLLRPITDVTIRLHEVLRPSPRRRAARRSEVLTEEEIKTLVIIGSEEGVLETRETEYIHNVFRLHDRRVDDLMTPRVRVFSLDVDSTVEEVRDAAALAGYSRIPLYEERPENIVGYVDATDLLWDRGEAQDRSLRQLMQVLHFFPQTKHAGDLLRDMHRDHLPFAGVVDEHGGFAGIVSLEDAVEQITGEIQDLHDRDRFHVTRTPEGDAIVAAHMELSVLNSLLGLSLADDAAETVGGFVINRLGFIPSQGVRLQAGDIRIQVEAAQPNRILTLRIHRRRRGEVLP
jgi:putative hemolysin